LYGLKTDADQFRPVRWKFENVHEFIGPEPIHFENQVSEFSQLQKQRSVFSRLQEACRIAETAVYDHGSMTKECDE
jgi:hypothetical protein